MSDLISSELSDDEKNSWSTDPFVYNAMYKEFRFSLDAAASDKNAKCDLYLTKDMNALDLDWAEYIEGYYGDPYHNTAWLNCPYGRGEIKKWMQKCIEQKDRGVTTVMLVPSTLDAQWLPINDISEIRIITGGRLSFYHPETGKKVNGNTKGSMFVIFRPSKMPLNIRLIDRNELLGIIK